MKSNSNKMVIALCETIDETLRNDFFQKIGVETHKNQHIDDELFRKEIEKHL